MSAPKAIAFMLGWFIAYAILYCLECASWPAVATWHINNWQFYVLWLVNSVIIQCWLAWWRKLRG